MAQLNVGVTMLRGCPRCRGDIRTNKDMYGYYRQCVQCGYLEDLEVIEMAHSEREVKDAVH